MFSGQSSAKVGLMHYLKGVAVRQGKGYRKEPVPLQVQEAMKASLDALHIASSHALATQ
jgi:hypothetical protein